MIKLHSVLFFLMVLLSCQMAAFARSVKPAQSLYELSVTTQNPTTQEPYHRFFKELERTSQYSIIETDPGPGSVAGPMFIAQGGCALLRARHQKAIEFTINDNQPTPYKLRATFPNLSLADIEEMRKNKLARNAFSIDECQFLGW